MKHYRVKNTYTNAYETLEYEQFPINGENIQ